MSPLFVAPVGVDPVGI